MPPTDVLIVEDSTTFTYGLQTFLEAGGEFRIIGTSASRAGALELAADRNPQVVLTDMRIRPAQDAPAGEPADINEGLALIEELQDALPEVRVLAMSSFAYDADLLVAAIRAGARGFVDKDKPPEAIVQALRIVAEGGVALTPEQMALVAADQQQTAPDLTPRERDVLEYLADGKTNREIADALGVAEGTVRTHVEHIRGKFGVSTRGEAVAEARRLKLV